MLQGYVGMCREAGGCCQQFDYLRQYRPPCSQTGWAAQVGQIRGCECSNVNSSPRGIISCCVGCEESCLKGDGWDSMVDINPGHLKWMQSTCTVGGETAEEDIGGLGSCSTEGDKNDGHRNSGNGDKEEADDGINGVEAAVDMDLECGRHDGSGNLLLSDTQTTSQPYESGSACDRAFTRWYEQIKVTGLQVSVDGCRNVSIQDYRH